MMEQIDFADSARCRLPNRSSPRAWGRTLPDLEIAGNKEDWELYNRFLESLRFEE